MASRTTSLLRWKTKLPSPTRRTCTAGSQTAASEAAGTSICPSIFRWVPEASLCQTVSTPQRSRVTRMADESRNRGEASFFSYVFPSTFFLFCDPLFDLAITGKPIPGTKGHIHRSIQFPGFMPSGKNHHAVKVLTEFFSVLLHHFQIIVLLITHFSLCGHPNSGGLK